MLSLPDGESSASGLFARFAPVSARALDRISLTWTPLTRGSSIPSIRIELHRGR